MIVNLNAEIKDVNGNPHGLIVKYIVVDEKLQPVIKNNETLTGEILSPENILKVRDICKKILFHDNEKEGKDISRAEKFEIGMKILKADQAELTVQEVTLLQRLSLLSYETFIAIQFNYLLEGKTTL